MKTAHSKKHITREIQLRKKLNKWQNCSQSDGTPFSEVQTQLLKVGRVVLGDVVISTDGPREDEHMSAHDICGSCHYSS